MLKGIVSVILVSFVLSANASELFVLKVSGKIWNTQTNQLLTVGQKLPEEITLRFENTEAKAVVISREKGRFTLQAKPSASQETKSELVAILKEALVPQKVNIMTSTRATEVTSLDELTALFDQKSLLLLQKRSIKFHQQAIEVNSSHFFYLRFNHQGETINKKLSFSEGAFDMVKSEILTIDGTPFSVLRLENVQLFYFDAQQKKSVPVAVFQLEMPDLSVLRAEAEIIGQVVPASQVTQQLTEYLTVNYGLLDPQELSLFNN